jgi:signal transduction histidine kinase
MLKRAANSLNARRDGVSIVNREYRARCRVSQRERHTFKVHYLNIVCNLISNSSKFTEQGFIKLSIGLCDDESIDGNTSSTDYSDSSRSLEYDVKASQFSRSMKLLDSAEEGTIDHNNRGVHLKIVVSDS